MKFICNEEGKCPICGSENLDYDSIDLMDGFGSCYYPWTCNKCGAIGKEFYDIDFSEVIAHTPDGDMYGDVEGICPECGGNLDYGLTYPEGESLGYEYTCEDCGGQGYEWYNLEFTTHDEVSIPQVQEQSLEEKTEKQKAPSKDVDIVWTNGFTLEKLQDAIKNDFDSIKETIDICYIEDREQGTSIYLAKYNGDLYLTLSRHNKDDYDNDFENTATVYVNRDRVANADEKEFKKYMMYLYKYLVGVGEPIKLGETKKCNKKVEAMDKELYNKIKNEPRTDNYKRGLKLRDEIIDAWKNKDLETAYAKWSELFDLFSSVYDDEGNKTDDWTEEQDLRDMIELHMITDTIEDKCVYDVTDYGKAKTYRKMGY